ncbi:MAG: hypothetical protein ACREHV_02255 [Rhizomicrobium sp.]
MFDWHSWWRWAETNSFALLLVIYFSSTACLLVLALRVHTVGCRLARLVRAHERQALLIDKLTSAADDQLQLLEARWASTPPAERESPCDDRLTMLPHIRDEIARLQEELASDRANERDLPSPPREDAGAVVHPDAAVEATRKELERLKPATGAES